MCRQQSPQSHCLRCKNYLLPTASQPTHIKRSGCTHCPAQSQLQWVLNERVVPFTLWATVSHCAASKHRDTSLNQNFTVGNKGLNTEVLKASGEDTDSKHFVLHVQRLGHKQTLLSPYFNYRAKEEFSNYLSYFWMA